MKKKIGIIGWGYVGKAMDKFFQRRADIYDVIIDDISFDNSHLTEIAQECDYIFVCVPTPLSKNGSCDTSIVSNVCEQVNKSIKENGRIKGVSKKPILVIKSTVEVGFTEKIYNKHSFFYTVFSPEFCGESKYWSPYEFDTEVAATPFFIFGGYPKHTSKCVDLFLTIAGPEKKYFQCGFKEAEMIKYVENSFYATKIAYCNQVYDLCQAMGIDWNTVREGWQLDPRVSPMHTAVFAEDRGFGGKCFPKDTAALQKLGSKVNVDMTILKTVLEYNKNIRDKND